MNPLGSEFVPFSVVQVLAENRPVHVRSRTMRSSRFLSTGSLRIRSFPRHYRSFPRLFLFLSTTSDLVLSCPDGILFLPGTLGTMAPSVPDNLSNLSFPILSSYPIPSIPSHPSHPIPFILFPADQPADGSLGPIGIAATRSITVQLLGLWNWEVEIQPNLSGSVAHLSHAWSMQCVDPAPPGEKKPGAAGPVAPTDRLDVLV